MKTTATVDYASALNGKAQIGLSFAGGRQDNEFTFDKLQIRDAAPGEFQTGDEVFVILSKTAELPAAPSSDQPVDLKELTNNIINGVLLEVKALVPQPVDMEALANAVVAKITPLLPATTTAPAPNDKK